MTTISRIGNRTAFTLVELMVAVTVITIGMVFVLGAFNQCLSSMTTAEKMVVACGLLEEKMPEIDAIYKEAHGAQPGEWDGDFEDEKYKDYSWSRKVWLFPDVKFGIGAILYLYLCKENVSVSWKQGKSIKDVSVQRIVRRKPE